MTISQGIPLASHADSRPAAGRRRTKKVLAVALASLVGCAAGGPAGCTTGPLQSSSGRIGPSGAEVTAAAIGVGAVVLGTAVLIDVHHSHHTVKGCVFSGKNGLQVQTQGDMKTYALVGDTANIKVDDLVGLHGTKLKKGKGNADGQTFTVEKISRDYGPCKLPQH